MLVEAINPEEEAQNVWDEIPSGEESQEELEESQTEPEEPLGTKENLIVVSNSEDEVVIE